MRIGSDMFQQIADIFTVITGKKPGGLQKVHLSCLKEGGIMRVGAEIFDVLADVFMQFGGKAGKKPASQNIEKYVFLG